MDQKELDFFKDLLKQKLTDLEGGAGRTLEDMTETDENYPDPTDRASVESDRSFELRLRDRERKLIKKIRLAIDRIKDGTYGECEECGEDIGFKRLKARPVTTMCIKCKSKQEQEEKAKGG